MVSTLVGYRAETRVTRQPAPEAPVTEDATADLHLPWLDLDVPAGSTLVELRVWQREGAHHQPEVAAAALVAGPDGGEVFGMRHIRPGHEESDRAYGGEGRTDYIDELEILWLAFNHDATLVTADVDEALDVLIGLEERGSLE